MREMLTDKGNLLLDLMFTKYDMYRYSNREYLTMSLKEEYYEKIKTIKLIDYSFVDHIIFDNEFYISGYINSGFFNLIPVFKIDKHLYDEFFFYHDYSLEDYNSFYYIVKMKGDFLKKIPIFALDFSTLKFNYDIKGMIFNPDMNYLGNEYNFYMELLDFCNHGEIDILEYMWEQELISI